MLKALTVFELHRQEFMSCVGPDVQPSAVHGGLQWVGGPGGCTGREHIWKDLPPSSSCWTPSRKSKGTGIMRLTYSVSFWSYSSFCTLVRWGWVQVPCGLNWSTVSSILFWLLCSLWKSLMMTLPAHLEAKFQGFGMEEFFQGHHGKGGENIIKKARILCWSWKSKANCLWSADALTEWSKLSIGRQGLESHLLSH